MIDFQYSRLSLFLPIALMAIDILAGFVSAWAKKKINTSIMRKGLAKKFGEILVLMIANVVFYSMGLSEAVVYGTAIYISAMEFLSVCKNLEKLGVKMPKILTDIFETKKQNGGENE